MAQTQRAPVKDPEAAQEMVENWKKRGERIVFTNGCFDLIHPGHLFLLEEASKLGDRLVVALNTDASVRRLKGPQRPLLPLQIREALVAALRWVDLVTFFDEDTPASLIRRLTPHVLVKGEDYRKEEVVGAPWVESHGGRVVIIPLKEGYSTTLLAHKRLKERLCYED